MLDVREGRVPEQVAGEKIARLDAGGFQGVDQFRAGEGRAGPQRDHVAKPGRVGPGRRAVQDQVALMFLQAGFEHRVIAFPRSDDLLELCQLRHADGGLHVRHLQVVADVRVNVFVIIAEGQRAELLRETFAAGVILAAGAVAVPAPVAQAPGDAGQVLVGHGHRAAFAHRNVVCGIEAERRQVPKGGREPAVVAGAQRVAVILHQPEVVAVTKLPDLAHRVRHAHRVGDHHRLGLGTEGCLDLLQHGHIAAQFHIHKHRHGAILHDRRDGCGEAGRHGDHLVAGLDAPVLQLWRGQRGKRNEVGRRAGVDQQHVIQAEVFRQPGFKLVGIPSRRQPEVERGIHETHQLSLIKPTAGVAHEVLTRAEGPRGFGGMKLADEVQDLAAEGLLVTHGKTGGNGCS